VTDGRSGYTRRKDFATATANLPFHRVFLFDRSRQWYQSGADGFDSIDETCAFLKTLLSELGGARLVTLGTSMGGYAALLFGSLLGVDAAVAFDAQTFVDGENRARYRDDRFSAEFATIGDGPYSDLPALLGGARASFLLFGSDFPLDGIHALRAVCRARVYAVGIPSAGHRSAGRLLARQQLSGVLEQLTGGELGLARSEADIVIESSTPRRSDLLRLFEHLQQQSACQGLAAELAESFPRWAFAQQLVAKSSPKPNARDAAA
jgi:pimeloyl-ACP methyl ester carboxylesterase